MSTLGLFSSTSAPSVCDASGIVTRNYTSGAPPVTVEAWVKRPGTGGYRHSSEIDCTPISLNHRGMISPVLCGKQGILYRLVVERSDNIICGYLVLSYKTNSGWIVFLTQCRSRTSPVCLAQDDHNYVANILPETG